MEKDSIYMKEALKQARKAYKIKEVPIGCVIVYEDKIIARGYNKRNIKKNTLAHAEILAINKDIIKNSNIGIVFKDENNISLFMFDTTSFTEEDTRLVVVLVTSLFI